MRTGIIGNNLYGQVFTRAVEANPPAVAVAICSELGEPLEPFASQHNLKAYSSLKTMLQAERLDAVMVASVTALHEQDTLTALEAGASVLVDRPMAMDLQVCDRMVAAARSNGRILMVGQVLQFWPEYVAVRELVQKRSLGQIQVITASRVSGTLNPGWQERLLNPAYGLGGLEAHIHDIDFLTSLLGVPESVTAQGRQTEKGGWVQVHSLLHYENGARASVEADYSVPLNFPLSMYLRVVGSQASLVYTFRGALAAQEAAQRSLWFFENGAKPVELPVPLTDAYTSMVSHFFECIREGVEPEWGSPFQARRALEVLLAIAESAGSGAHVRLSPPPEGMPG